MALFLPSVGSKELISCGFFLDGEKNAINDGINITVNL